MFRLGVSLLAGLAVLATCSPGQISKITRKKNSPLTAVERQKLIAKVLTPVTVTDRAALEKEFAEVQSRYPRVGDYLSKQEAQVVFATALATQSCLTLKDQLILTTAAKLARRSACGDTLTIAEADGVLKPCWERLCLAMVNDCIRSGGSCEEVVNKCRITCGLGPTCPPACN